jgi:hypothetical protein
MVPRFVRPLAAIYFRLPIPLSSEPLTSEHVLALTSEHVLFKNEGGFLHASIRKKNKTTTNVDNCFETFHLNLNLHLKRGQPHT